jgi:uncharacterized protein with HEPN domain
MRKDDTIRLRHMLDSAQEAQAFLSGRSRKDLEADRMLLLSLVKSVEIIGEAASRISPEARAECPGISWPDIIAMRNRLIHAYFDIDRDIVWRTVSEELPPLIAELEKLLLPGGN